MGDSHEQLEGLARGLSPVVLGVHPNSLEINTNTHLAIPKVPRGRHGDREFDGKIVPIKNLCDRDPALRPLVMAAVGSGLLVGGFFFTAFFEAGESCISVSSSSRP